MEWVNAILNGVLTGGLFALFAAGLSIIFGVMRLVNLAHGDLIVLAAYIALVVIQMTGLHPLMSIAVVAPVMFGLGYALQRGVLNFTLGKDLLPPLLVTFGLSIVIQNGLLEYFSADTRRLQAGPIETASLNLGPISIGYFPTLTFAIAVGVILGLELVFRHTHLGRIFRATSDRQHIVALMGVDSRNVFALAMGLALAICAVAGVLLGVRTNFSPDVGPSRLIYAFEAVIMGGLGNLWGTLAGGVILGVSQAVGAKIHPGLQILAGHLVFLAVLVFRPQGLFPRTKD
jgi:branched-chain amino acid transport system permease protein